MLEQSIERAFREMADKEQPQSRISVQQALREGRGRLRRRRVMHAAGAPLLAVSAALAIALPSGILSQTSPQAASYGKLVGGAFDPSYLAIGFGWLPKHSVVTDGATNPGGEGLRTYAPNGSLWALAVYAPKVCRVTTTSQFTCLRSEQGTTPITLSATVPITGAGGAIHGHEALWLDNGANLAWQYAPGAWAVLQHVSSLSGKATAIRIARAVEFGQHVSFSYASRFTSLPHGWRIVSVGFEPVDGVYLARAYGIARLHSISPRNWYNAHNEPAIQISPAVNSTRCGVPPGATLRQVTIHGYRFMLSDLRTTYHGVAWSDTDLCGVHVDGLDVSVGEQGRAGHLAFPPTAIMERLQLLGAKPANWVASPLP